MNSKQKQLIFIFIFLFILTSVAITWNDIAWLFNYRVVGSLVYDFFNPYEEASANNMTINSVSAATIPSPAKQPAATKTYPDSQKSNSIEIPAINITAPIVISANANTKTLTQDLDTGVVFYPGSVMPAEIGQAVILGHSAPSNWPNIKYDWVFTHINDLNIGDAVIVYLNHKQYTYRVVEKNIIQAGQDVQSHRLNGKNNILTLISCWPPGQNYKRIRVDTELIES